MKSILTLALFLFISHLALAENYVFRTDSPVPSELQEKIINQIKLQCPAINSNSLQEIETSVRVDSIDQGIQDYYFSSLFSFSYYFDGQHPISYKIGVESTDLDINNPPEARYNVNKVQSLDSDLCQ